MMTLEELWENLRQDPEIKATMEEADRSYKLFKKIENLIVADLEAKLAEKGKEIEVMKQMLVDREETIIVAEKSNKGLILNYNQLKKQLDEMKKKKNYYKKKHKETLELKVNNQNQTAIAELEKVKEWLNNPFDINGYLKDWEDLDVFIYQQIKELKGEK